MTSVRLPLEKVAKNSSTQAMAGGNSAASPGLQVRRVIKSTNQSNQGSPQPPSQNRDPARGAPQAPAQRTPHMQAAASGEIVEDQPRNVIIGNCTVSSGAFNKKMGSTPYARALACKNTFNKSFLKEYVMQGGSNEGAQAALDWVTTHGAVTITDNIYKFDKIKSIREIVKHVQRQMRSTINNGHVAYLNAPGNATNGAAVEQNGVAAATAGTNAAVVVGRSPSLPDNRNSSGSGTKSLQKPSKHVANKKLNHVAAGGIKKKHRAPASPRKPSSSAPAPASVPASASGLSSVFNKYSAASLGLNETAWATLQANISPAAITPPSLDVVNNPPPPPPPATVVQMDQVADDAPVTVTTLVTAPVIAPAAPTAPAEAMAQQSPTAQSQSLLAVQQLLQDMHEEASSEQITYALRQIHKLCENSIMLDFEILAVQALNDTHQVIFPVDMRSFFKTIRQHVIGGDLDAAIEYAEAVLRRLEKNH